MSDDRRKTLNVLPNRGKLDELRKSETVAPTAKKLNDETPIDRALDASLSPAQRKLKEKVVEALQTVYDPELPVNLYDLGLIYKLAFTPGDDGEIVDIDMTLTAPNCPVAEEIPQQVQSAVAKVAGIARVRVELVWSPKWDKSRMSEAALLELGLL